MVLRNNCVWAFKGGKLIFFHSLPFPETGLGASYRFCYLMQTTPRARYFKEEEN